MNGKNIIHMIIPALNERETLPLLLKEVRHKVAKVIVVDNGSDDDTALVAKAGGAHVIVEPQRGYGRACLTGVAAAGPCDVLVFMDADFCDDPAKLEALVAPILRDEADFVLGSRMGPGAKESLSFPQFFGNRLACVLMRLFWGARFTDLGPFRAITPDALTRLDVRDQNFGWTVEMQISAVRHHLRIKEIPVPYRNRIHGKSKISGTLNGVLKAGYKILYVIAREALR